MFDPESKAFLLKAVSRINTLDESKFPLFLNRIANSLTQDSKSVFTEEEESKLLVALDINNADLKMLTDAVIIILKSACYNLTKPSILQELLETELKFDKNKAESFSLVWSNTAKSIVDFSKQKSLIIPQLSHISFAVSIESGSNQSTQGRAPLAQLQLGLISAEDKEDLNIEFTHKELFEFYNKLEKIQSQLDALK